MRNNIQAVVYDWDDVILSVAHGYFQLLQETATKLRLKPFTFEEFSHVYGLPEDDIVRALFGEIPTTEVIRTYQSLDAQNTCRYTLIPGAKETLSHTLANYPINGILTARRRERLAKRAMENGIDLNSFNFVFTAEDIIYPKPDPRAFEPVKRELECCGLSPDVAVYVGDSVLDFQASNGAGLRFVGVLTGLTEKYKFVKYGLPSMRVIQSVGELPALLQGDLNG